MWQVAIGVLIVSMFKAIIGKSGCIKELTQITSSLFSCVFCSST